MSGFCRLIEDGRLMYWHSRQNCGFNKWLLTGHVEGHPFPICVPESATVPEPGAPVGRIALAVDNDVQLPCDA